MSSEDSGIPVCFWPFSRKIPSRRKEIAKGSKYWIYQHWTTSLYSQQSVEVVDPAFAVVVGVVQAVQEEESVAAL